MSKSKTLFSWFSANEEAGSRSKDAEESLNREWKGNGYNLTLEELKR